MTWGARAGRSALLALLAVAWAVLAHRLALPAHPSTPPRALAADLPALAWAACASGLLSWWLAAVGRGDRGRRALAVGGALTGGQLVTHSALALSPLLALRTRMPGAGHLDEAGHLHAAGHSAHGGAVDGALSVGTALQALSHGGGAMLLAHVVATVAAALAWAVLSTLARAVGAWWVLRLPGAVVLAPSLRRPSRPDHRRALQPHLAFSWDGRGPPALAV